MHGDNALGEFIQAARRREGLTQDLYAHQFQISGPAVFKFERGYVTPSLELWIKIADRAGLPRRQAVLIWVRAKLPIAFRHYIEMPDPEAAAARAQAALRRGRKVDYSGVESGDGMRRLVEKDKTLPSALRDLLLDGEVWKHAKPTGHEINLLRDRLAPLGHGSKAAYANALRLLREWTHSF